MRCYESVSRLKINLSKSTLLRVGCSEESEKQLEDRLHCKVGHLPIYYLGLPIGANATSKKVLDPKVEKFEKKLSIWKRQYLSFEG